jgi:hypothetical protein
MDINDAKKLLVGYWPLLDYSKFKPGQTAEVTENIMRVVAEADTPPIAGVLWSMYPFETDDPESGVAIPIFIMNKAAAVAEHLETWLEGDNSRFTLHFEQREEGYSVLLLPDIRKSIERFKAARLIYFEEIVTDNNFDVIYQTLGTCCIGATTFEKVKAKIASPCHVGFVELDDIDPQNLQELDPKKIVVVGPFAVVKEHDQQARHHLDRLFSETVEPVKSKLTDGQSPQS